MIFYELDGMKIDQKNDSRNALQNFERKKLSLNKNDCNKFNLKGIGSQIKQ